MEINYTAKDLEALNDALPSADAFSAKQAELFGEGFRQGLDILVTRLKCLGYTGQSLHRHGVILGILLAHQKMTNAVDKQMGWSDWE